MTRFSHLRRILLLILPSIRIPSEQTSLSIYKMNILPTQREEMILNSSVIILYCCSQAKPPTQIKEGERQEAIITIDFKVTMQPVVCQTTQAQQLLFLLLLQKRSIAQISCFQPHFIYWCHQIPTSIFPLGDSLHAAFVQDVDLDALTYQ